jgi:fatty acid desaturase
MRCRRPEGDGRVVAGGGKVRSRNLETEGRPRAATRVELKEAASASSAFAASFSLLIFACVLCSRLLAAACFAASLLLPVAFVCVCSATDCS